MTGCENTKKSSSSSTTRKNHPPSTFNALILYGVIPVMLFIAFSFVDDRTLGLLDGIRVNEDFIKEMNAKDRHRMKPMKVSRSNGSSSLHEKRLKKIYNSDSIQVPPPIKSPQNEPSEPINTHQRQQEVKASNTNTNTNQQNQSAAGAKIDELRESYDKDPNDMYKALHLAVALLNKELTIHDGGTLQTESIDTFLQAIELIVTKRDEIVRGGGDVHVNSSGQQIDINDQLGVAMENLSIQGLLVEAYNGLSRQYFMADMFEKAVAANSEALTLEPACFDALHGRASSLVILGKYNEAGADYSKILELDSEHNVVVEVCSGIVKVLQAKEDSIPNGWALIYEIVTPLIQTYEKRLSNVSGSNDVKLIVPLLTHLKKMHFALFAYHENKSGDAELAWHHLTMANRYKMAGLAPYDISREQQNLAMIQNIFKEGFWPKGVGSTSRQPIFIVGFPRSGSTLLERILDAHPLIVGTGENSVFNGMLHEIRNGIVQASSTGSFETLATVVHEFANKVDAATKERWIQLERNRETDQSASSSDSQSTIAQPKHFVDKMLTNYMNIGFIHMLFPNAVILHIAREPMDTAYSAFKHEFPPGGLDYTSDFEALASMFSNYRQAMDHWDKELPGRITHIRYEDIVHDKEGIARSLIKAIGLEWDDDILNFHKKKQAVNTLSSTQVRKGIYKDTLKSWKRHEDELLPLVNLLGESNMQHKFRTTLRDYHQSQQ